MACRTKQKGVIQIVLALLSLIIPVAGDLLGTLISAPVAEMHTKLIVDPDSLSVRPAMGERFLHRPQNGGLRRLLPTYVTGDAAHF